ncbi:MAG TPA: 30S ribosomal protein S12 methylthiotransferase RimO [Bdellovibrionota bacterium]|jgi:ribosomal protein S12 methylthiotransferase|nr:30S ribosomal protein S12 methylthiotransferase RimO [Bdellovibrionota bacterium]
MKNVHIVSLGCARNLVDSEVMAGLLTQDGYALTPDASDAEVIIVNTCGFIDAAKQESIDSILEAAAFKDKEKGKCQSLVVAGCLSERYPGELKDSIPEIDLVTGTAAFSHIVSELEEINPALKSIGGGGAVKIHKDRLKDFDLPRVNSQASYTAYLKLAEGCAKRCSFCIIPKLRGKLRSRSMEMLVKEAEGLVAGGVRELNLIAQDLTDYGRDRTDGASLNALLKELVKIEGLDWVRLFYAYPDQLTDDVLETIATEPKICKYLDVPIQHINDTILQRMNRHCSGEQIRSMLVRLKEEIPGIVLRTSLMVGFPGETEEQFNELAEFVAEGLLDQVGVFTYSHEEGTGSFMLGDDVPAEVKEARRAKIFALQESILKDRLEAEWVGKEIDVLVEGAHDDTDLLLKSRHYGQAPGVDNITIINEGYAPVGSIVRARVTEVAGIDLVASIVEIN